MTPGYLLRHSLGEASGLLDDPRADDLDFDPPAGILQALAERTGIDLGVVRLTTIAGWVPWLADTLDPCDGQEAFDTYVRQHSVLLAPGEAGRQHGPALAALDSSARPAVAYRPAGLPGVRG